MLFRCIHNRNGVTLPELMMVMVILAIAGTLAFPKMKTVNALRQKTYAYDSLKTVGDALRKYDQDFDADILTDKGADPASLLDELENKGYLKKAELFKQGQDYCLSVGNAGDSITLGVNSNGVCLSPGVTFSHYFSMQRGREGAWFSYQICSSENNCTPISAKKITYAEHPESF